MKPLRPENVGRVLLILLVLLVAALLLPLSAPSAQGAQVTYLEGTAQVRAAGQIHWRALRLGDRVGQGDALRTGSAARLEVTLSPRRQIRIGPASLLLLETLREQGGLDARLRLQAGRFWASLRRGLSRQEKERFAIATPASTIGVKGTRFGVDFDQKTETMQVAVVEGQVAVDGAPREIEAPRQVPGPREIAPPREISREQWSRLVSQGKKLVVRAGDAPRVADLMPEDRQDPWMRFNLERDQL